MRFLVLTAHTDKDYQLGEITKINKYAYCARHCYNFKTYTSGFDITRPYAWSKIKFIQENLEYFDWVFWIDSDAIILNESIRLEDLIDFNYDLIVPGVDHTEINNGAFLIRHTPLMHQYLQRTWNCREVIHDAGWEQKAMSKMFTLNEFKEKCKIVPMRVMNSWDMHAPGQIHHYPEWQYQEGDFILHLAGLRPEIKLSEIKRRLRLSQ